MVSGWWVVAALCAGGGVGFVIGTLHGFAAGYEQAGYDAERTP